jgi:hypothetical protein
MKTMSLTLVAAFLACNTRERRREMQSVLPELKRRALPGRLLCGSNLCRQQHRRYTKQ